MLRTASRYTENSRDKTKEGLSLDVIFSNRVRLSFDGNVMLRLLFYAVWVSTLYVYVRGFIMRVPSLQNSVEVVVSLGYAALVVMAWPVLAHKFSIGDYLFYLVSVAWLLANYAFYPDNAEYLNDNVLICIFCVFPFYFIGRLIDIEKEYSMLLVLSLICVLWNMYYYFVFAQTYRNIKEVAQEDNMYAAYQILPHVVFVLWSALEKVRIWKLAAVLGGVLFLLSCGTRGPLVCLGFFGAVYFFFFMKFKGAMYVRTVIVIVGAVLAFNLREIVLYLAEMFTGLHLSTRILEKFIMGEMGNDSYRSVLRDKLYDVLNDGHFFGIGAFGTRNYDIIYPHYLPLDFACTYGYFIGYVLLVLLFALIVYATVVAEKGREQVFLVYLFSISVVKLFLSNSFILEPYFYFLIGACVKVVMDSRQKKTMIECSHE